MDSRLMIAGHAVHPMLIPLPLGMFLGTLIFDNVYLLTDDLQFATVAFFMAVLGTIGGVAAAATGAVDYMNIPKGTRQARRHRPRHRQRHRHRAVHAQRIPAVPHRRVRGFRTRPDADLRRRRRVDDRI